MAEQGNPALLFARHMTDHLQNPGFLSAAFVVFQQYHLLVVIYQRTVSRLSPKSIYGVLE
jgi:hypothetical protein